LTSRRSGIWPLLALFTLVGLVVSACTQQGGGPTTGGPGQADSNGELVTNMGTEPDTVDPQVESFVQEIGVTMRVFEALMTPDIKTGKPIPAAAKDQPKVSSDGKTYTYTLRDGLKYSDGQPVTSKNFKYGWQRLCDPATAGNYSFTGYIVVGCEAWNSMDPKKDDPAKLAAAKTTFLNSIETPDDKTITFHLTDPAPYFNAIASTWVGVPTREDMVTKGGDKWTEPATYIGNGPFILSEWKHNEKMTFTRNPNFRTPTKLAKWTQVMINEGAVAFAAYRNNELDVYGVQAEDLRTIQGDPDLTKQAVSAPDGCSFYVGFNTTRTPFNDKNARIAFAKSFDRDAYITDVAKFGKPSTSFISEGLPGYDAGDTFQKFDVTAAKAALAQVSPAAQAALSSIKITYSASTRATTRLQWFQDQWKKNLGISVALDPVDSTTYTSLVKKLDTTPQVYTLGWCPDYYDQQDWLTTVFDSKSTVSHSGWKNDQFDNLVRAADKEPDPKKRDDMYQQASRILSQDAPVAFTYYETAEILQKPWVQNYVITALGFEEARFTDVYVTKKS
jgi:oligopeptide transport system substrate-binding protein